jgi:hypothetical protein
VAITEQEKVRIRHHLGYLNVAASQTFVLGAPAALETQFLIEGAMNRILPEAEGLVREHLAKCDFVEQQVVENQELLAITVVGEIQVRQDEFEALMKRYHYWRNSLANDMGIYPNPFDKRFAGVNIPVLN